MARRIVANLVASLVAIAVGIRAVLLDARRRHVAGISAGAALFTVVAGFVAGRSRVVPQVAIVAVDKPFWAGRF